ncbi:MAG: methyltransferase domain-containing protein [Actinomycetota bacterium]
MAPRAPMPPLPLANRVGSLAKAEDPVAFYEQVGADTRKQILRMLPAGYELEGRRLLDFGCGAGRTLRHFLDEASSAEIWGCDIDEESIDWLQRNLCPPLHAHRNEAAPGLPFEDGHFDLVWAVSVFTHLAEDAWAAWMLELHRVLADDGILIATSIGPNHSERFAGERWEEDRIGINALRTWASWDAGGPVVLHSTWWLRAHWGRAFEILELHEPPVAPSHRWLAMRKRDATLTVEDLERLEPGELRELTAMRHHTRQLRRELEDAHDRLAGQSQRLGEQSQRLGEQGQRLGEQRQRLGEQGQRLHEQSQRLGEQAQRLQGQAQRLHAQAQRLDEQERLLRAMLGSRAFVVAEQLSRLRRRGRPVFSRQQVSRALGDRGGSA